MKHRGTAIQGVALNEGFQGCDTVEPALLFSIVGSESLVYFVLPVGPVQAIHMIGMPEARIILSETAIYLAVSAKSNSAYAAINKAMEEVKKSGNLPVPLHLRNAPTKLMKQIGYGKDYKYAHNYEDHFVMDQYLPEELKSMQLFTPGSNPREAEIQKQLERLWKSSKNYGKE